MIMKERFLFICRKNALMEEVKDRLLKKYEVIYSDNFREGVELNKKLRPSYILIEDLIKGQSGTELSRQIKQEDNDAKIVLLVHEEIMNLREAKIMSAADYVIKYPKDREDLNEIYKLEVLRDKIQFPSLEEENKDVGYLKEGGDFFSNLGDYKLIKKVAEGGMADIYLAAKTGISGFRKLLILKLINSFFSRSEDFVKRFMDEAKIGAFLNHKNIIHIYDYGMYEGQLYIAMEYVKGKNLDELMKDIQPEKIPLPIAVYIIQEICYGLSYAYNATDDKDRRLNVIHRDLSPHNILISLNGEVKIADFGVAKATISHHITEKKALVGKLSYMSPEQINGAYHHSSDIFSLGIIFYQMLTNQHPFISEENCFSPTEIIQSICRGNYKRIEDSSDKIKEIEFIVYKMLEKNTQKRYSDAALLLNDLLKISWASNQKELKEYINNVIRREA